MSALPVTRLRDLSTVPVTLSVRLGSTSCRIADVAGFCAGSVIELDQLVGAPLEIYAGDHLVGRGRAVAVDGDGYGVEVTEWLPTPSEGPPAL